MPISTRARTAVNVKRVYEPPSEDDGLRVLVDRVWPRGFSKSRAKVDQWMKDLGPTDALRKWFGHDPARWLQFKKRYFKELAGKQEQIGRLLDQAKGRKLTLVYSAKDTEHNQAVALKEFMEQLV